MTFPQFVRGTLVLLLAAVLTIAAATAGYHYGYRDGSRDALDLVREEVRKLVPLFRPAGILVEEIPQGK